MNLIKYLVALATVLALTIACQNSTATSQVNTNKAEQSKAAVPTTKATTKKKSILFFGNSLTAGLGVDPSEVFVAVIQQKLDSLNLPYRVINSGVSGETTSAGLNRIDWILDQYPVDIFVLELGANDALRGIDLSVPLKNLQSIIDKVKAKYPEANIVLAGMEAPPNMGQEYTSSFRNIYPALAKKNGTALIPFLLDGVGGIPELNQHDGIHPTPKGHQIVADVVWEVLKDLL